MGRKWLKYLHLFYTSSEEIIEFPQILTFHDFLMKVQIFHDFQGLKNIKVIFNDFPGFPWPVRSTNPVMDYISLIMDS